MTKLRLTLEHAKQMQARYTPNARIATHLRDKSILMFVAPTSTGKTYIMNQIASLDSRFARVPVFTTRESRADDDPGMFRILPHDEDHIKNILSKVETGDVVQYIVHPSGRLYGSELQDYPSDYNMLATISDVVDQLSQLSFKQARVVGIVTDADTWEMWLASRFPEGNTQRQQRIREAIHCLEWLLARDPSSLVWVKNIPGQSEQTAKYVIDTILENKTGDDFSHLAEAMLQKARTLL